MNLASPFRLGVHPSTGGPRLRFEACLFLAPRLCGATVALKHSGYSPPAHPLKLRVQYCPGPTKAFGSSQGPLLVLGAGFEAAARRLQRSCSPSHSPVFRPSPRTTPLLPLYCFLVSQPIDLPLVLDVADRAYRQRYRQKSTLLKAKEKLSAPRGIGLSRPITISYSVPLSVNATASGCLGTNQETYRCPDTDQLGTSSRWTAHGQVIYSQSLRPPDKSQSTPTRTSLRPSFRSLTPAISLQVGDCL